MFIYVITNTVNGMQYVGQTINPINYRWNQHKKEASNCTYLSHAIKFYGESVFKVDIVAETDSIASLNALETQYIHSLNTLAPFGYNLTTGGDNKSLSDVTKTRISQSSIGKRMSQAARQKMSINKRGSKSPTNKLRESDVRTIRNRLATGERQVDIAKSYNVSKTTINRISKNKDWAWLD